MMQVFTKKAWDMLFPAHIQYGLHARCYLKSRQAQTWNLYPAAVGLWGSVFVAVLSFSALVCCYFCPGSFLTSRLNIRAAVCNSQHRITKPRPPAGINNGQMREAGFAPAPSWTLPGALGHRIRSGNSEHLDALDERWASQRAAPPGSRPTPLIHCRCSFALTQWCLKKTRGRTHCILAGTQSTMYAKGR